MVIKMAYPDWDMVRKALLTSLITKFRVSNAEIRDRMLFRKRRS